MNKRIFALMLALVMSFTLLAACGSKDSGSANENTPSTPDTEVQEPSFGADLNKFYNDMMAAAEEAPMMMDLSADAEMLESMYPGLGAVETKQLVVAAPMMSAVAMEFAFVEVANAADVETVKTILQTRIDNQVAGGAWYPETIEQWEKHSEIVVIDNFVCLFVTADKAGLIDAFRNATEIPVWAKAQAPAEGEGDVEGGIMDMPVEDGPAAYDPEAETSDTPAAESSSAPEAEEPVESSTPAVNPEPAPAPEAPAANGVDLTAFYTSLCNQYGENFPANMNAAEMPDMMEGFFPGLSAIETKQLMAYQPMMGAVVCEIVLVEVANSADVEAVKTILQSRIDTQVDGGAWYPESIEGWQNNSRIAVNGNYIMMIAYSECDAVVDAFNALF